MAELSKTQLKSDNNQDFPNNNIGAITPAILRSFNADMIDSNVNQTIYNADSASWTSDIDVLQAFSASQYNLNKTLATTGSNTFVGNQIVSGTIFTNALDTTTGNTLTIYSDLDVSGSFVSNLQAGYVWLGSTNGRAVAVPSSSIAAGGSTDLSALNAFTASQNTKNTAVGAYTASLNAYTASNDTKWNTIGLLTGSYATTGSNTFVATQTINADLIVSGTISAYKINTTIESSSVIFSSGSNILGDSTSDTQTLNGTVIVSGSQRITGSTSTTDAITINKSGGNGLVLSNSGIQSAGAIVSNDSISIYASGAPNVNVQANANGTGSQYPGMAVTVAPELYPTDIYGGFSINSSGTPGSQPTIGGMITQTYSTQYGTTNTFMIVGENATTAIAFPSGAIELWKPTNVKSGLSITGSVGITGSATISGNQTIGGAQTLNGNNNVVSGSITFNGTSRFNNTASLFNSVKLNNSIFNGSNFLQIDVASGSIVLQSPNAAGGISGLTHLSSSAVSTQVNLIFKNNNNTGDTIISGSNNIFTNPNTPTTGYKRYIGGNNNLYLNQTNGITSQVTQSATTISGAMPVMNNNIFTGTGNFIINQALNPGTHTYSQNIITGTGTTTINALGFTGSLNLLSNFNNNGTITINAASASNNEITGGLSGSGTVTMNSNGIFGGTITNTSPRTLLTTNTQTTNNNLLAGGSITVTNISSSAAFTSNNNIGGGNFTYTNAGAAGLGLHTTAGSMSTNYGAMSLIASASAIQAANNISPASMTVTNRAFSGSLGLGALGFNNNQTQGASNTYTVSGSFGGTGAGATMQANGIFGASNTIFTNVEGRGNYVDVRNNLIGGTFLILTGSNNLFITASGGGYFGRFNANDGLRNGTGENIFVVGTGGSETTRKTGFLIDSGSNTFVEGTLNVSGSTSMTGSLTINGSTIVSGSVRGNVLTQAITSTTASFDFSTANFFELTLVNSTNTRVEATNVRPGQTINVLVNQASSPGNGTISFSTQFDFPAVSPYTASVIADAKDILTFVTFANTGSIYAAAVKNLI